jgi:NADPH:quinone reductase
VRAALYDRPGPAREVLRLAEVDRPEPGRGQVRVRHQLSGVNPTDWKTRSGATPRPIETFQIPNQDGAGVIDAVGVAEFFDIGQTGHWRGRAARRRPQEPGPASTLYAALCRSSAVRSADERISL